MSRILVALALAALAAPAPGQFTPNEIFVAGWKKTIYRVDPTTWTVTTFADASHGLDGVSALVYTPGDRLLASNYFIDKVLEFDSLGNVSTKWDATHGINGPFGANGLTATLGGHVFVSNFDTREVLRFDAAGGAATVYADAGDLIVHPDGLAFDACNTLWIANREGRNLIQIDRNGVSSVFDKLPDQPMSIAVRDTGDVYVACLYGDIYLYRDGIKTQRSKFLSFGRRLATPIIRFSLSMTTLLYTSSGVGNLLTIDADTAQYTEVLPPATFLTPLSLEVVGERRDVGLGRYGSGLKGAGDIVPSLDADGHPVFTYSVTLKIRDFVGGALAEIVTSDAPDDSAYGGGRTYVDRLRSLSIISFTLPGTPGVPGDGDHDITDSVPIDPALDCTSIYVQVFALDAAAAGGISMSNALEVSFRAW